MKCAIVLCILAATAVSSAQSLNGPPHPQSSGTVPPQKDAAEAVFASAASKVVFVVSKSSGEPLSLASGVILSADGYIATNYHALQGAEAVEVRFFPDPNNSDDFQTFNAVKLLHSDRKRDIAVLKVNARSLPFLQCSTSDDCAARIGEKVYAIGNPKGLTNSISEGIVSALRTDGDEKLIQHTAPISHGSSGGALVDSDGALLGMNSWQLKDGQNLNFAISAKSVLEALAEARNSTTVLRLPPDEAHGTAVSSAPLPDLQGAIPRNWISPKEGPDQTQDIQVQVTDPYVFILWAISVPEVSITRKQSCIAAKTGSEWRGTCNAAIAYNSQTICDGLEQQVIITRVSDAIIEGKMEHMEFPKNFPKKCPHVNRGDWRSWGIIPRP